MAVAKQDTASLCAKLITDARAGRFETVYLLMGDEPYYPDLVCRAIIDNCIPDFEKDFNETICFGSDVTAEQVITAARRYPMMAQRQLVVVKEAQLMKDIETLSLYCGEPLDSTVLVILLHNASVDKRKSLYKSVQKSGVVVDSPAVRDYQMPGWITAYYNSRGLRIDADAASLLTEFVGTDISTVVVETDKLLKSLPEGTVKVSAGDIERNVGMSRRFSVFELTKELSNRNSAKAIEIATNMGLSARFQMPETIGALSTHFYRILKYGALLSMKSRPSQEEKAAALMGVNPYFYKEYDLAVRNYPIPKAMAVISMLCEYDYLGKGGDGGSLVTAGDLLRELVSKILSV